MIKFAIMFMLGFIGAYLSFVTPTSIAGAYVTGLIVGAVSAYISVG